MSRGIYLCSLKAILFAGCCAAIAQTNERERESEAATSLYANHYLIQIIHRDGEVRFTNSVLRNWSFEKREYALLNNPAVLDELNADDDTREKIERFLEKLSDANTEAAELLAAKPAKSKLLERHQQLSESLEKEFRNTLNAEQRRVIQGIAARSRLMNQGLTSYLLETKQTHPKLAAAIKSIKAEFANIANEELRQTTKEFLSLLNDDQKTQLNLLGVRVDEAIQVPIEIQIWQLQHAIHSASSPTKNLIDELARGDIFTLDLDGFLVEHRGTETSDLVQAISLNESGIPLELSLEQQRQFSEKAKDLTPGFAADIQQLEQQWRSGEITGFQWQEKFDQRRAKWKLDRWEIMSEILIPAQQESFAQWNMKTIIAQRGAIAALIDGTVHKRLEITGDQRNQLLDVARQRLTKLQTVSKEMSQSLWRDLKQNTSVEFTANLRRSLNLDSEFSIEIRSPQLIVRD